MLHSRDITDSVIYVSFSLMNQDESFDLEKKSNQHLLAEEFIIPALSRML